MVAVLRHDEPSAVVIGNRSGRVLALRADGELLGPAVNTDPHVAEPRPADLTAALRTRRVRAASSAHPQVRTAARSAYRPAPCAAAGQELFHCPSFAPHGRSGRGGNEVLKRSTALRHRVPAEQIAGKS